MGNGGPLADLIAEMDAIVERTRRTADRSGYFAAMYRGVTREIDRRCAAAEFEDGRRMAEFARSFARRYLDAERAAAAEDTISASWASAFAQGRKWKPVVLQHLMLGMNAHINFDLGIVTAEFADSYGIDTMATDFHRINDVLGSMIESCQRCVGEASPWVGLLDRVGGRTDTRFIRFSLDRAREAAWHTAQRLAALGPDARPAAITELDARVAHLADLVLDGPFVVDGAVLVIRLRETRSVRRIIDVLATAAPA